MSSEARSAGSASITKAHDTLMAKGIVALDGSGDPNVEALFARIAHVKKGLADLQQKLEGTGTVDKSALRGQVNTLCDLL